MSPTDEPDSEEMTEAEVVGEFLSDEQWRELAKLSTLPDGARGEVESLCFLAKQFYEAERPQTQQRRRKMIREAADLAAKLKQIAVECRESNVISVEKELEDEKRLVEELEYFERKMLGRIKNFKTGPVSDGFHFVVQMLNHILIDHSTRTLNLSAKRKSDGFDAIEFVVKFFEFSGVPNHGTILRTKVRNAIKELVDLMGRWEPEYRPGLKPRKDYSNSKRGMGWMFKG